MMRSVLNVIGIAVVLCGRCSLTPTLAQDATVETVLTGLDRPSGLAIRPEGNVERHEVYISDGRAGRIVRMRSDEPGKLREVIKGFGSDSGDGTPAGLLFLNSTRLVVALEDAPSNLCLRLYDLSDETFLTPKRWEQAVPIPARNDAEASSANAYALARTFANDRVPDALIATFHGLEGQPGLWRIPVRADLLGNPAPFSSTNQPTQPATVAISRQAYVVVASAKAEKRSGGSRLTFHNPLDGSIVMEMGVDLQGIRGIAYSPRTGNLYAADFGSSDRPDASNRGGVFRIDDASLPGEPACRAVKVADVRRPTALAFGPDGSLYVTAWNGSDDNQRSEGVLLRISGEL